MRIEALTEVTHLLERCKAEIRDNRIQSDIISSFSIIIKPEHKQEVVGIYNKVVDETNSRLRAENAPFHLTGKLEGQSFYFVAGYYDKNLEMPVTASTMAAPFLSMETDGKEEKSPPKLEEMDLTLNEPKRQAVMELAYILSHRNKDSFIRLPVDEQVKAIHKAVQHMVVDDAHMEERKEFYGRIGYAKEFWFFIRPTDSVGVKLPNETLPADLKGGSVVGGDCDEVALICRAVLGSCGIKADVVQFFYTREETGKGSVMGHTTLLSVGDKLIVIDSALLENIEDLKLDKKDVGNEEAIKKKITELYKDRQKFDISRIAILHNDNQIKARTLENNWYDVSKGELTEKNIEWIQRALEADSESAFSNVMMADYLRYDDKEKARSYLLTALRTEPDNFLANKSFVAFVLNNELSGDYLNAYESVKRCYSQNPKDLLPILALKEELERRLGKTEDYERTKAEINSYKE